MEERNPLNDLVKEQELAKALGVSASTLTGLRQKGMPYLKIGGRVWFNLPQTIAWIVDNCERRLGASKPPQN